MAAAYDRITVSRTLTKILSVCGIWPWTRNTKWHRVSRAYGFCLQLPLSFTLTALMVVEIFVSDDLKHATDVMHIALTEAAHLAKIVNMWYYSRIAVQMLTSADKDEVFSLRTTEEEQMWTAAQRKFGLIYKLFLSVSMGVIWSKTISVFFLSGYELPYHFWMPFDWHEPPNYWYAFFYSTFTMPLTVTTNITLDMFHCYLMFHITLCFKVLGQRMEQVGHGSSKEAVVRLELLRIVVLDQHIRRMCRQCESIVSVPIFTDALLSAFVLCLCIYQMQKSTLSENPGDFASLMQYAIALIIQIFLPCYYANELTASSQLLSNCLYSSNWTQLSANHRRFIFIYMEYLQRPIIFRAGGFFEIGLPIFTKTLNNAYSLLALMLNIDN